MYVSVVKECAYLLILQLHPDVKTYNSSSTLLNVNKKNNHQLIYRCKRKVVKVKMLFGFPVFRPRKRGEQDDCQTPTHVLHHIYLIYVSSRSSGSL